MYFCHCKKHTNISVTPTLFTLKKLKTIQVKRLSSINDAFIQN